MAFKKRRMMFVPEVNAKSFVFFFERGTSGTSWSIRDYSIRNRVKELGPHHFHWTADDIHEKANHSLDAPTVRTDDLAFWHEYTCKCNKQYLQTPEPELPSSDGQAVSSSTSLSTLPPSRPASQLQPIGSFPILNLPQLLALPKGRKTQDTERILHSPTSEDWVTWNFFQVMFQQYPTGWWAHLLSSARRRNPGLCFPLDDRSLPRPILWSSIPAPSEYEAQSRIRMQNSGNAEWVLRAGNPEPVEGNSEIDVSFEHDQFLVYVEAKLGSDISMDTKYDPQRNQIVRNIDCLIANSGDRIPMFWMLVRDEAPERAYVQLMNSYKAEPKLLASKPAASQAGGRPLLPRGSPPSLVSPGRGRTAPARCAPPLHVAHGSLLDLAWNTLPFLL
jgi:hypothetical protein